MGLKHEVVDRATGEITPAVVLTKKRVDWPFAKLCLEASGSMGRDRNMTEMAFRVFHVLCCHMDYQCVVKLSQVELASDMGYSRQAVNGAIKVLVTGGYIQRLPAGYKMKDWILHRGGRVEK